MNKETFLKYVKDPNLLNSSTLPETDVLVTEFPYCQTARILLTLNLFKEKHVLYDKQLKLTAVQAGNRRILKKHIDKLGLKPKPVVLPDEEPKPFSEVHPLAEVTPPEPEQKPGQSQQPDRKHVV